MNQESLKRRIEVEQFSAPKQAIFKRGSIGGGHHILSFHLPPQHFTSDRVGPQGIRPGIGHGVGQGIGMILEKV